MLEALLIAWIALSLITARCCGLNHLEDDRD